MEYEKRTFPNHHTHPVFLSTVGALFGLEVKPINDCSVLELNCGDGGNIIPFSFYYPQMQYVGIDLEEKAVEKANELISKFGLDNIQILKKELNELNSLDGQFDFIIVNRLYSWVDPAMRNNIWGFCKTHLSENGMIYINFNTMPGWAELLTLRKLIQYRIKDIGDSGTAINEIRKFLPVFSKLVTPPDNINSFSEFLYEEVEYLNSLINSDRQWLFFDDFIGIENNPLYFSEFLSEARDFGFKFLTNCDLSNADRADLPGNVLQLLQKKSKDMAEFEQYIDFFVNQKYREVLLCKSPRELNRDLDYEKIKNFFVKARFEIKQFAENNSVDEELVLISQSGMSVKVNGSLMGEVADKLKQCESSYIQIEDLFSRIAELQEENSENRTKRYELALFLISLYLNTNLLDMRVWEISQTACETDFYKISPLIRQQTQESNIVTNHGHFSVFISLYEKRLLQQLPLEFTIKDIKDKTLILVKNEPEFKEDIEKQFGVRDAAELQIKSILEKFIKKGLLD